VSIVIGIENPFQRRETFLHHPTRLQRFAYLNDRISPKPHSGILFASLMMDQVTAWSASIRQGGFYDVSCLKLRDSRYRGVCGSYRDRSRQLAASLICRRPPRQRRQGESGSCDCRHPELGPLLSEPARHGQSGTRDIKKEGSGFDLPIAIGIIAVYSRSMPSEVLSDYAFLGELALDGMIRPVKGVLPMAVEARKAGMILPKENVKEVAIAGGLEVRPMGDLI